jgi:lysyl-tRNA synthetase class 2
VEVHTETLLPVVLAHPTTVIFSVKPKATDSAELLYLQASPELAMRQLVAKGAGEIFQICHAFRDETIDATHDREFLLLEWYIPGISYLELREDVSTLIKMFLHLPEIQVSCESLFRTTYDVDLFSMDSSDLARLHTKTFPNVGSTDQLDVVRFDQLLGKSLRSLAADQMVCVCNYPQFDTCFGQEHPDGYIERFEIFLNGLELANGYQEIESEDAFLTRFRTENEQRVAFGLDLLPEPKVINMPRCAGVAVGLDRLFSAILPRLDSI